MTPQAPATTATRPPVMSVRGLTKDFTSGGLFSRARHRALNAVDLDIPHGRIVALVGSPAAGSPPWPAAWPAWSSPPGARSASTDRMC